MTADDTGFQEFVNTRYVDLLRLAYHLTGSTHEAEDLLQSALVKVCGRWKRIDDPMAYLRRVMVNDHARIWRRYRSRETATAFLPDRAVRDAADGVADRHAVYQAMRSLSPRTRAVIVLRYVADLPEAEVAATLGCSVGTVKSRASRGLARLREALTPASHEVLTPASREALTPASREALTPEIRAALMPARPAALMPSRSPAPRVDVTTRSAT